MKIGLNCERILIQNPAGPEKYTINLIKALSSLDKTNNYICYFKSAPSEAFWKEISSLNPNFTYKVLKPLISWTQVSLVLELFKNSVDVFFSPVHTIPFIVPVKTKRVSMIHGLEFKYTAENLENDTQEKGLKGFIKKYFVWLPEWYTSKFSNRLIVPSDHTKASLIAEWQIPAEKITIISEGVSNEFFSATPKTASEPYLIFVSTIEPRKNIPFLVKAFAEYKKANPSDLELYIVGKKGWMFEESLEAPKKYGVENDVKFMGRVSDSELISLLSGAKAFVSSSKEEGFGLHLVEAMACGLPCLVTNISSYKEIGSDSIKYFESGNSSDFCQNLSEILKSSVRNIPATNRAKLFSWDTCAKKTLDVFLLG